MVTDYDYAEDEEAGTLTTAESALVETAPVGMIPVRVRGVSGYMHGEDLQKDQLLEIVFVDVGQGDGALLVTPDDKKFVIDAGVSDNMFEYLRWRFTGFEKAHTDFDGLIITHPDKDHYFGFNGLIDDQNVQAAHIWHSGIVEQFAVTASGEQSTRNSVLLGSKTNNDDNDQGFLTGLIETDDALKQHLSNQDRWIKKTSGKPKQYPDLLNSALIALADNGERRFPDITMLSTAHGEITDDQSYLPGFGPDNATECVIEIIGPVVEPDIQGAARLRTFTGTPIEKTTALNTGKTKNGHSVLLKLTYKNARVLFGGDLNSPAEMFLLHHYTGLPVYDAGAVTDADIVEAGRPVFGADISKACHHGSADFTDVFLSCINPAATVISSGDNESHAHPRSDTLGAIGHHGRGHRSLIFSTELARSTKEFSEREDSPWFKAHKLETKAKTESDAIEKAKLIAEAKELNEQDKKTNVTVYGSINLRSDGDKIVLAYMLEKPSRSRRWDVYPSGIVLAYMLEKPSRSRRWDVYPLEPLDDGSLHYLPVKEAEAAEEKRRQEAANG